MIDYLAIGHVTADLLPDGRVQPGGTALYAALTAQRLGLRAAIVTACAPDLDLQWLPPNIEILRQPAPVSTTFINRYDGGARTQHLLAQAPPIALGSVPGAWWDAQVVHWGPVAHELPLISNISSDGFVGVTPQGLLRSWDSAGLVTLEPQRLRMLTWGPSSALVLSEEDVLNDETLATELAQQVPLVALTRAERGATIWHNGQRHDVPASPATVVDPTGAGDVWAAAFFVALGRALTPIHAAGWACAAAACAIEGQGFSTLPTVAQVEARLNQ